MLTDSVCTADVSVGSTLPRVAVSTNDRLVELSMPVGNGCEVGCKDVFNVVITLPAVLPVPEAVADWTAEVVSEDNELSGTLLLAAEVKSAFM